MFRLVGSALRRFVVLIDVDDGTRETTDGVAHCPPPLHWGVLGRKVEISGAPLVAARAFGSHFDADLSVLVKGD
jgi:hypothetical protein